MLLNVFTHFPEGFLNAFAQGFHRFGVHALGFEIGNIHGLAYIGVRTAEEGDPPGGVHGQQRHTGAQGNEGSAGFHFVHQIRLMTGAFGEDAQHLSAFDCAHALTHGSHIGVVAIHMDHVHFLCKPADYRHFGNFFLLVFCVF